MADSMRPASSSFTLAEGLHECPAHDDRRPSLTVSRGDDGRWLVFCFAGCRTEAILVAAGLAWADLFPMRPRGARAVPIRRRPRRPDRIRELLERDRRAAARLARYIPAYRLADEVRDFRTDATWLRHQASGAGDTDAGWRVAAGAAELDRVADVVETECDATLAAASARPRR
jgi:hypothetical protein